MSGRHAVQMLPRYVRVTQPMPKTDIYGNEDDSQDDELTASELSEKSEKPYTPTVALGIIGVTRVQAQAQTLPVKLCFTGFALDLRVNVVKECVLCLVHNCTGQVALNINNTNLLSSKEGARLMQKTEYRDSSMMAIVPDQRSGKAQQADVGEDSVQWILDENKVVKEKPSTIISINGAVTVSGSLENIYDFTVMVVSHHPELVKLYAPQYAKKRQDKGRPVLDAKEGVPMFNVRLARDDIVMVGVIFPMTKAPWAKIDPSEFKPIRYDSASSAVVDKEKLRKKYKNAACPHCNDGSCRIWKGAILCFKCWSQVIYVHLPSRQVCSAIEMVSEGNVGKMSSEMKSEADAAAKALVESMAGGAPSAAARNDLTKAGERTKRQSTELALVPERMIARSVLDKDPVDRRSVSGYINKTVASFFSQWSMWMKAEAKSYRHFCASGYNPWMRKSGVTVVKSLRELPRHDDPRIQWDWVSKKLLSVVDQVNG